MCFLKTPLKRWRLSISTAIKERKIDKEKYKKFEKNSTYHSMYLGFFLSRLARRLMSQKENKYLYTQPDTGEIAFMRVNPNLKNIAFVEANMYETFEFNQFPRNFNGFFINYKPVSLDEFLDRLKLKANTEDQSNDKQDGEYEVFITDGNALAHVWGDVIYALQIGECYGNIEGRTLHSIGWFNLNSLPGKK